MTSLYHYLEDYQPGDRREEVMVAVLWEGLRLQGLQQQGGLNPRQQRRLEFQQKKWRSQVIALVFYQLPTLSKPRREIQQQYREEYDSLCNGVAAEFCEKILTDFNPQLVTQGASLTAKLSIWVNSKLRLKWRLLELLAPQKKEREIRVMELMVTLARRSPEGFTKEAFLASLTQETALDPQWAERHFLELVPQFWSAAPEAGRYFLDPERLQHHLDHLWLPLYTIPLDPAIAAQLPAPVPANILPRTPTVAEKITRLLTQYRPQLQEICLKQNPDCHCFSLLETYFRNQLDDEKINEEDIVRLLGIKRPTYQSHLERKCLPAFWELTIEQSPVSQPDEKTHKILLKTYIETDPNFRLRECYYTDQNQRNYRNCNCQNLAQKRLIFFIPKPEKWKNLALLYQLTVDTLTRFWRMKCLFLLSLVVFELERDHTDCVKVD